MFLINGAETVNFTNTANVASTTGQYDYYIQAFQSSDTNYASCRADLYVQIDGDFGKGVNNSGTGQGSFTDIDTNGWMVSGDKPPDDSSKFEYNIYRRTNAGDSPNWTDDLTAGTSTTFHGNSTTWTDIPASSPTELTWHLTAQVINQDNTTDNLQCMAVLTIREKAKHINSVSVAVGVVAHADTLGEGEP
jgi:hypothetical protein